LVEDKHIISNVYLRESLKNMRQVKTFTIFHIKYLY